MDNESIEHQASINDKKVDTKENSEEKPQINKKIMIFNTKEK